jgi:2-phospho-L-lactate/phosphoenolpyruvate guanylyltransferase
VSRSDLWAVVPAKSLAEAKQRLAGVLTPEERQDLARAMLGDVLAALAAVPSLAGSLVVTRDAELAALGRSFGAHIMTDLRHEGPTSAVTIAATWLAAEGASGMLAVPADVPLVTPAEIAAIVATMGSSPAITLVPALADMGTNAVALSPPDAIPLRFGLRSFFRHQEAALERGIAPRILRLPGLGLDVDRPDDLATFVSKPSATRSYAYLAERSIIERLRETRSTAPGHDPSSGRAGGKDGP